MALRLATGGRLFSEDSPCDYNAKLSVAMKKSSLVAK
jgi:hypothetical protein